MSDDSEEKTKFNAQVAGLILAVPALVVTSFLGDRGRSLIFISIYAAFAGVFYVRRRDIWNMYYIVSAIIMLLIELPAIFLVKLPPISAGIAAIPVALVNYALIESVLRGVKRLFRLPDWRS